VSVASITGSGRADVPAECRDGAFVAGDARAFLRSARAIDIGAEGTLVKLDKIVAKLCGESAPK
jgi:hypothetical protein